MIRFGLGHSHSLCGRCFQPTAVDIKGLSKYLVDITEHSMCQPGYPSPRGGPAHQVLGLRTLPQRKVGRMPFLLPHLDTRTGIHSSPLRGRACHTRKLVDREVDIAVALVSESTIEQPLHPLNDLGDVAGSAREILGRTTFNASISAKKWPVGLHDSIGSIL
jgi:hypothetical protein